MLACTKIQTKLLVAVLTILSVVLTPATLWAAVPPTTKDGLKAMILEASHKKIGADKLWSQVSNKYKDKAVPGLLELLSDESERDNVRWSSLFGIARLSGKKSYDVLKKYSTHNNWVLRDASLRAMAALDAKDLRHHIEKALDDKALVVRTTAVDVIGHISLKDSGPALLGALTNPENFRKEKPLWIHDHVLAVLKQWRYKPAVPTLAQTLSKYKDQNYRAKVISALETITGRTFAGKSADEQVYLWQRHAVAEKTF